jgi:hypothetical protein
MHRASLALRLRYIQQRDPGVVLDHLERAVPQQGLQAEHVVSERR